MEIDSGGVLGRLLSAGGVGERVHVEHNSDNHPHRGEAPGPVKNGVNFSSYGKAKNGLSMATEPVLKGGNTEHAISDPLFVRAHIHARTTTYGHYGSSQSLTVSRRSLATRERT